VTNQNITSREQWLEARRALLENEKEFIRKRDALSLQRRQLPWVRVEKDYRFEDDNGTKTLIDLFGDKSQLIVQHFMMGEDWDEGCPSCSFWADGFNGTTVHLAARDAAFVSVSSAPLKKIQKYKQRMRWTFDWVSSHTSDFNTDFHVSFTEQQRAQGPCEYNFREVPISMSELPGISIFVKDLNNQVFHTYSCYSRGLDNMNVAYQYLDLLPKGRDEDHLDYAMSWVRRNDSY